MTNAERIQKMMIDIKHGNETAERMGYNPETKRLEVISTEDAAKKHMLWVTPEDMKVSHSSTVS